MMAFTLDREEHEVTVFEETEPENFIKVQAKLNTLLH